MSSLTEKYRMVLEGKMTKAEFLRQARQGFPQQISQFTSYNDAISIFKNKGMLSEEVEYQCPGDKFSLGQIEKGLKYELLEMGVSPRLAPSHSEYEQAKKKAIDNLAKDPLHYVKLIEKGKMFLQEQRKQRLAEAARVSDEEKARRAGQKEVDEKSAQRLFNALMQVKSAKRVKNRWMADDANKALSQVRARFEMPKWVPKGFPSSISFSVKDDKFSDEWEKGGAATKRWTSESKVEEGKLLREAISKVVTKVLAEAATTNLATLSDQNASIQGIPAILNSLENIVTEVESFILKEQTKIQGVFDNIGNIKNEDNIPIGYKFVQPIMDAFAKDLQPVLEKISLDNIKVPEAPESLEGGEELQAGDEPVGPGIDPENLDVTPEEKATLFTPKGKKPNPLA